jgi:nicotinate-nucleotide adenylyltransferase
MRVGVVGGTFDPIHLGHVAMAEGAASCAGLDRVILVPARVPPHRPPAGAPARDRLQMCRIAVAGRPRLEVSDIELRRRGPSYTVDTLRQLHAELPRDTLYLVLGWDAARELANWRQPDEVLRLAWLVVVSRPGLAPPSPEDLDRAGIDPGRAVLCNVPTPDVGATDVRRHIEEGAELTGLLDPAVERYITSRGLYR